MRMRTLVLMLALGACTSTEVSYEAPDGTVARLSSTRLWTDTSVSVATPELQAAYSSDADGAAALSTQELLMRALLEGRLAPAVP